jgi:hypothetical protein
MRNSALLGRQHVHAAAAAPARCTTRRTLGSTSSIARSRAAAFLRSSHSSTRRVQSSSSTSRSRQGRTAAVRVAASLDYVATASDDGVLKLPARTELDPEEIKSVFAFPRYVFACQRVQADSELYRGLLCVSQRCQGRVPWCCRWWFVGLQLHITAALNCHMYWLRCCNL